MIRAVALANVKKWRAPIIKFSLCSEAGKFEPDETQFKEEDQSEGKINRIYIKKKKKPHPVCYSLINPQPRP